MASRRPEPKPRRGPPAPPEPGSPSDFDEEIPEELGDRSAEEIYGEADLPEEEYIAPSPSGAGLSPARTRIAQLEDLEEAPPEPAPDATLAGPPVRIEIASGPDEGNVRRFRGVRMVVGRGKGCDLELTDQTVSRRHLEMVHGEKGMLLRDLNSTTGTKVNGEKVSEKFLTHGDEIQIGRTKLRYIDEVALFREKQEEADRLEREAKEAAEREAAERAAAEAEAAEEAGVSAPKPATVQDLPTGPLAPLKARLQALTPMQQRAGILVAIIALFLMPLGLFAVFHKSGPPPPSQEELIAGKKYELAHKAMEDERFQDAVNLIEQAERLKPGVDSEGLLASAKTDLAAQTSLNLAKSLIDQNHFEDARAELARTPTGTDAQVQRQSDLMQELESKQTQFLLQAANDAIAQGNFAMAQQVISALPPTLRKTLQAQLDDAQTHARVAKVEAAERAHDAREAERRAAAAAQQRRLREAFGPVSRKLEALEYDRAVLECDRAAQNHDSEIRAKAHALKALIPKFRTQYEDGLRKGAEGSPELSVRPLRKARAIYLQMGLPGPLGQKIDHLLAKAALAAAKTALGRDDLPSAVLSYREALGLEPGNGEAKAGMKRLQDRSEAILLDAYMIRDRDPRLSMEKLKLVLQIAPRGSPSWDKAKKQLSLMQP
jgi:pSer/pThr/pTyr-binding forkhead associated (FHA) protein